MARYCVACFKMALFYKELYRSILFSIYHYWCSKETSGQKLSDGWSYSHQIIWFDCEGFTDPLFNPENFGSVQKASGSNDVQAVGINLLLGNIPLHIDCSNWQRTPASLIESSHKVQFFETVKSTILFPFTLFICLH